MGGELNDGDDAARCAAGKDGRTTAIASLRLRIVSVVTNAMPAGATIRSIQRSAAARPSMVLAPLRPANRWA